MPLAYESVDHLVVVRIRCRLSLLDRPAEEPRRVRIDIESPVGRGVLWAMAIERENSSSAMNGGAIQLASKRIGAEPSRLLEVVDVGMCQRSAMSPER